ncbi:MAG: B12-binding domain-containing radical SAM protein [Candidatus Aenigmatarchaeota archaeon]
MVKILAVNPQFTPDYIHSARWDSLSLSGSHWYPVFLSYMVSLLEKHSHECRLVDAEAENLSDSQVLRIAKEFKPDFSVLYISERGLGANMNLAKSIKNSTKSKIIFVGPWCSLVKKEKVNKKIVDFFIEGEFEFAVLKIVEGKGKKGCIRTERLTPEQLKDLGWVTKIYQKHLNINNYRISSLEHRFVDLLTSRKCYWGRCSFCLWPSTILQKGGYVERDIEDSLDEIEWAWNNLNIKEIFIQDDTISPKRAKELSEGLIKRCLKISWACYARGDLAFTQKIVNMMAKSGCRVVHIGFESGNNEILKRMNKGTTVENLTEVSRRFRKVGIDVHGDFMIGNIGETRETIQQTMNFIKKLDLSIVQIAPPKLYGNCKIYEWYAHNNEGAYIDKRGLPNLKDITYEEMVALVKKGLRDYYMSKEFISRTLTHPSQLKRVIGSAIPAIKFMFSGRKEVPV